MAPAKKRLAVKKAPAVDYGEEALNKLEAQLPLGELNDGGEGEGEWPTGISMDMLEHNGYVVVYHRTTREPSVILADSLGKQLKKLDNDRGSVGFGRLAFQLEKPRQGPVRGSMKCHLHVDDDDRDKYDVFGFTTCNKSNIPTEYQRNLHMLRKHKQEWATIQADKAEREKGELREFQNQIMAAIRNGANPLLAAAVVGSE